MAESRLSSRARRRRRTLLLGSATLVAFAVSVALVVAGVVGDIENESVDARFSVRGERGAPSDVVVVGIDDRTFDAREKGGIGIQWPFPRGEHARVIDALVEDGAAVIAYDVQFTEPSPPGQEDEDLRLLEAVAGAGERGTRVVLATTEVERDGSTRVLGGDATVRSVGARVGNAVTPGDEGAVVRRVQYEYDGLLSFAVVAAEVAGGRAVSPQSFGDEGEWIDFHGPPGTVPYYSFADVRRRSFATGTFKDRIVVVGATAPSLQDQAPTSVSGEEQMPGPELQAEAIQTVVDEFPLRGFPPWLPLALIGAFTLVPPLLGARRLPLLGRRLPPLAGFAVAILVGVAYAAFAQLMFENGRIVPLAAPLTGLAVSAVMTLAVLVLLEASDRRRIHDLFARFVPDKVVDQVVADADEDLRLGGEQREATVLFSDLRGFTTYSESRPPADVIEILNGYLSEMTDAILDAGGTLVAYMGDGIMAVFGAPLDQPDHADRALAAAREMLHRLEGFNASELTEGQPPFRMGIGLNTGPVVSGNVGSERRLEYTTIGDTVNTASRIEGTTKGTPYGVLLADTTVQRLGRRPDDLELYGEMEIRGRRTAVKLWGVRSPMASDPDMPGAEGAAAGPSAGGGAPEPVAHRDA